MNKNNITFAMTDEQAKYFRDKANESAISMKLQVSNMLHEWYSKNKDKVDEVDINKCVNLNIVVDEETERIYKLFITNMINSLMK